MDCSFSKDVVSLQTNFHIALTRLSIFTLQRPSLLLSNIAAAAFILCAVYTRFWHFVATELAELRRILRDTYAIHSWYKFNSFLLHVDLAQFIHGFQCFVHGILRFSWISHFFCVNHSYLFRDFKVIYSWYIFENPSFLNFSTYRISTHDKISSVAQIERTY